MSGWESMECVFHGESSHVDSIMTTKKVLTVAEEQGRACRAAFIIFACSYSGTARHALVHW